MNEFDEFERVHDDESSLMINTLKRFRKGRTLQNLPASRQILLIRSSAGCHVGICELLVSKAIAVGAELITEMFRSLKNGR